MPPLSPTNLSPTGVRVMPSTPERDQAIHTMGAILADHARHKTSARMASRLEQFAADVSAARAASQQVVVPVGGTMREQKETAK